jgi:hypothetical protein
MRFMFSRSNLLKEHFTVKLEGREVFGLTSGTEEAIGIAAVVVGPPRVESILPPSYQHTVTKLRYIEAASERFSSTCFSSTSITKRVVSTNPFSPFDELGLP